MMVWLNHAMLIQSCHGCHPIPLFVNLSRWTALGPGRSLADHPGLQGFCELLGLPDNLKRETVGPQGTAPRFRKQASNCSATVQCAGYFCRPLEGWANVEPCGVTWYWRCSERKSAPTKFVIETMARWNVWLGPWRWTPCWPSGLQPDLSFTRGFHDKAGKNMCSVVDFPCLGDHDEPGLSDLQSSRASWGTAWTCMNKGPCRASCRSSMSFFLWVAFLHIFAHWFDWCYFTQRNCPRRRHFHVWWGPFETDNEAHWNAKRQCSATVQCAGYFCRPLEGWANVEPYGVTWYWRCSDRKSAQTKFVIETMARWNVWLGPWRSRRVDLQGFSQTFHSLVVSMTKLAKTCVQS